MCCYFCSTQRNVLIPEQCTHVSEGQEWQRTFQFEILKKGLKNQGNCSLKNSSSLLPVNPFKDVLLHVCKLTFDVLYTVSRKKDCVPPKS